ncbi:hypothetical protein LTR50_007720 [Elasticomyces elasticus]|nr:hypothetical protein LTR50_007720 [Elasticomyces elasticus]
MTIPITSKPESETPFTSGARKSGSDVKFWNSYVAARPNPTGDFFKQLHEYHQNNGSSHVTEVAHDVGTGPGNIAARLAGYFKRVIGSDLNESALVAAQALVPEESIGRLSFIYSSAEDLAEKTPADAGGDGTTDLITVSECVPLLDIGRALQAFHDILRPGGTLAIYFYGPAVFAEGDNLDACNAAYDRAATAICKVNQPMQGTPGFPFHLRAAEALISYLDNIALPQDHKAGFDFDFSPIDSRAETDKTVEVTDRNFWAADWTIGDIRAYLDSVYPNWSVRADEERLEEVKTELKLLEKAMGAKKRKVTFPTVLILATKAG